jgi:cytoskeletal protein CcmA (bactofilin family)
MWGDKKSRTAQVVNPEPKIRQTNQPPSPPPDKDVTRPAGATADRATSRLGSSLRVKGEISGNEDLLIDGSVEGLMQLDGRLLTLGTTAKVTADIIAGEVVVYGKMKGNVRAKGRIEIKKDGSVDGDLTTAQIMIEDGAYFKGSIQIEKSTEKQADKNVFPPAA